MIADSEVCVCTHVCVCVCELFKGQAYLPWTMEHNISAWFSPPVLCRRALVIAHSAASSCPRIWGPTSFCGM